MELSKVLTLRRSYRSFSDKNISKEDLEKILEAGMNAPVAMGKYENTVFKVLKDEKLKEFEDKLISKLKKNPVYNCNKLILIYSKMPNNDLANLDAGCIGENIMLKATDLGISSVMVYSIKGLLTTDEDFKEFALIKNEYRFIVSIALGYRNNDETHASSHKIEVID